MDLKLCILPKILQFSVPWTNIYIYVHMYKAIKALKLAHKYSALVSTFSATPPQIDLKACVVKVCTTKNQYMPVFEQFKSISSFRGAAIII